jgi:hypothetical protein
LRRNRVKSALARRVRAARKETRSHPLLSSIFNRISNLLCHYEDMAAQDGSSEVYRDYGHGAENHSAPKPFQGLPSG